MAFTRNIPTYQKSKKGPGDLPGFRGDIEGSDPKTVLVMWLQAQFGQNIVWADRIHIPDSYVTGTDYLFAVRQVADPTIETSCHSVFNSMTLDVIVYERGKCPTAGSLGMVDKYITSRVKEIVGDYGLITIQDARRVSSRDIQFIEDNFRGRAIVVQIDYGYCI